MKAEAARATRFTLGGIVIVAIDFATFTLLHHVTGAVATANLTGMCAGFVFGFFFHRDITFRVEKRGSTAMFGRYLTVFLLNLVLAHFTLQGLVAWIHQAHLAKIITMGVVALSSYVLSRLFVFRKPT